MTEQTELQKFKPIKEDKDQHMIIPMGYGYTNLAIIPFQFADYQYETEDHSHIVLALYAADPDQNKDIKIGEPIPDSIGSLGESFIGFQFKSEEAIDLLISKLEELKVMSRTEHDEKPANN